MTEQNHAPHDRPKPSLDLGDILEGGNSEMEQARHLDWPKYRELADEQAKGVRKVGLLDKELAISALNDSRTLTVKSVVGDLPVLVPIEFAAGFDSQRSKDIARKNSHDENMENIYYFCLPPGLVTDPQTKEAVLEQLRGLHDTKNKIYFDFVETEPQSRDELIGLLSEAGFDIQEIPLRDERADVGYQEVTINFYKTVTSRVEQDDNLPNVSISEAFKQAVARGEFEQYPQNGAAIFDSKDLTDELVDKLWQVYEDRFQWLGENHPISMEENKEEFEHLLRNEHTSISIYFREGEPVCWTYFIDDLGAENWLQEDFIARQIEDGTVPLFFPGIVARADAIGGYSEATLKLPARMVALTSRDYTVMFETTNVSEQYIPRLVKQYVDETGVLTVSQPMRLDNTIYRLLVVQ